ncbi:MAG TPA: cysteine hydrolase [Pseudonocardiaceae bacterium]|jgi:nicotinamidase-related amidase|nr:cysteine hydrolase [Pseudonocardiaceae bacterium]
MTASLDLDPRHTALLVMDYQHGILGSLTDSAALLRTTADTVQRIRDWGGTIGHVRVAFTDADFDAIPATSQFAAMVTPQRRQAMHADSATTAIHDAVAPREGDIVVRKTRVGAFSTTDLAQRLREAGVTTLILAGIATGGVVLSTVREAADRDYRLVVLADACADPAPEVHDVLVGAIFPRQAHVTTTDELAALL